MAKKKSKTQNQKHHRVVKKLGTAFAKKLGVSQQGEPRNTAMLDASLSKPKVIRKPCTTKLKMGKPQSKQFVSSKNKKKNTMETEFRQEHAAVQERGQVMEWKRNNNRSNSKKNKKKGSSSSATDPLLQFAKPTFAFLDSQKSTQKLIQETTQRVQQNDVFGIGVPTPTAGMNSLAGMAAALQWDTGMTANTTTHGCTKRTGATTMTTSNPWAILDAEEQQQPTSAPFSFAPPSFAVAVPSATTEAEIDPDL